MKTSYKITFQTEEEFFNNQKTKMQKKNFIKSKVIVNEETKKDLSFCLNSFLSHRNQQQSAPFQTSIFNIEPKKQVVKYKKYLTDWRYALTERNLRGSEQKKYSQQVNQTRQIKNEIKNRPQSCNPSKTEKLIYSNIYEKNSRIPGSLCRKVHTSSFNSKEKFDISPFDPSLTPFVIVQNIYESSMKNLDSQKRAQTAKIRQYYEKKSQKVESFRQFGRLETKINQNSTYDMKLMEENNFTQPTTRQRKVPIYQRKSRRIIEPNEIYSECNRVKIPQKFVIKQYPV